MTRTHGAEPLNLSNRSFLADRQVRKEEFKFFTSIISWFLEASYELRL